MDARELIRIIKTHIDNMPWRSLTGAILHTGLRRPVSSFLLFTSGGGIYRIEVRQLIADGGPPAKKSQIQAWLASRSSDGRRRPLVVTIEEPANA